MTKHKHRPCPCGCGELADECGRAGPFSAFSISDPDTGAPHRARGAAATRFFAALDGADEPTIWERTDGDPAVVVRRAELPGPHADLLWRVLTGVLCADDEAVERVARGLYSLRFPQGAGDWFAPDDAVRGGWRQLARAVLAALRGEQ